MKDTMKFHFASQKYKTPEEVLDIVIKALNDNGYDAVNQLVGYFMSGDPTYITSHDDARSIIGQAETDELLEAIISEYVGKKITDES